MSGHLKWGEIRDQMSPESRERAKAKTERMAAGLEDDAPDIQRALSSDEWLMGRTFGQFAALILPNGWLGIFRRGEHDAVEGEALVEIGDVDDLAAIVALANDALNAEDVRKITRARVELLRTAAGVIDKHANTTDDPQAARQFDELHEFAEALESLLPDELTAAARITDEDLDTAAQRAREFATPELQAMLGAQPLKVKRSQKGKASE